MGRLDSVCMCLEGEADNLMMDWMNCERKGRVKVLKCCLEELKIRIFIF